MNAGKIATELVSEVKERLAGSQKLEQAEVAVRELLNEVGTALLSRFSEEITHEMKAPICPKCQQPMSPKEWVVSQVHTTFGQVEDYGLDYRCRSCKQYKRIHGYERPERARLSPLFSSILVLFGATWPQQVALFCALVTFGQKVSKRTVHNLLQKEAAPHQMLPLMTPENTRVCTDGVLVNGLEKGSKIEAKVVSLFSETQEVGQKGKQQVKDVSFLASGNRPWSELSGPLLQMLQERGVTD